MDIKALRCIRFSKSFQPDKPLLNLSLHRNMLAFLDCITTQLQFVKQLINILHRTYETVNIQSDFLLP